MRRPFFLIPSVLVSLCACSTAWTPTDLRPPASAPALRVKSPGQEQWLEIPRPLLMGDTALVWTPDPRHAQRVPEELSKLYWAGMINLRDVTEIEAASSECGSLCKGGSALLIVPVAFVATGYLLLRVVTSGAGGS